MISFQSMSYRTKAVSLPTRVSEDSVDLPPVPIISKTRLAKKMRLPDGDKPHEQAEPIATAPQTADQRASELEKDDIACELVLARAEFQRVSCMLDVERSRSRELINRLFSDGYNYDWRRVFSDLPPDLMAWVAPSGHAEGFVMDTDRPEFVAPAIINRLWIAQSDHAGS